MRTNDANKIVEKELSYKRTGIFFDVHNKLGRFLKEKQYADEVEKLFKKVGIAHKREFVLEDGGAAIGRNRVDFLVEKRIIVDIKAKRLITKEDYYQILRYLQVAGLKLGMIVNFRNTYLKPKRIVNPDVFA